MASYWAVEILGEAVDLDQITRALNPGFDPWIERKSPHADYAIRSSEFNTLQTALEVRDRAAILINILNGAVALTSGVEHVRGGKVLQVSDEGEVNVEVFGEVHGRLRGTILTASATVTTPDGTAKPPRPPSPTEAQRYIQSAIRNDDVADLLTFVGRADNWFDLYKAIEMAEKLAGGEQKLQALLKGGAADFKNARTTANWHRHARAHKPRRPATFDEACSLVRHAVLAALVKFGGI
tara:strand:- start:3632 stop:4345 length:714 start_codon:yes stop_codon:yes gene_type:complete